MSVSYKNENTFASEFSSPGDERSMEQKFYGTFVPENEGSRGRKFQRTKVPPCGTKVPRDESSTIHHALQLVLYLLRITMCEHHMTQHFLLPLITRCPALFSRIFFPTWYPFSLPYPALPHSRCLPIASPLGHVRIRKFAPPDITVGVMNNNENWISL